MERRSKRGFEGVSCDLQGLWKFTQRMGAIVEYLLVPALILSALLLRDQTEWVMTFWSLCSESFWLKIKNNTKKGECPFFMRNCRKGRHTFLSSTFPGKQAIASENGSWECESVLMHAYVISKQLLKETPRVIYQGNSFWLYSFPWGLWNFSRWHFGV